MWGSTPIDEKKRGFTPMLVSMGAWFWEEPLDKPAGHDRRRSDYNKKYDKRRKPRY